MEVQVRLAWSSRSMRDVSTFPDANAIGHLPTAGLKLVPSDAFLWLAGGSVLISLGLRLMGRRDDALFIGEWVPTMVGLGLFSRLVGR